MGDALIAHKNINKALINNTTSTLEFTLKKISEKITREEAANIKAVLSNLSELTKLNEQL